MSLSNDNEAPRRLEVCYCYYDVFSWYSSSIIAMLTYNGWVNLFQAGKVSSHGGLFHSWIGISGCLEQYVDSRRLLLHSVPCEYLMNPKLFVLLSLLYI